MPMDYYKALADFEASQETESDDTAVDYCCDDDGADSEDDDI